MNRPLDGKDPELRPGLERAAQGACARPTFISVFTPTKLLAMAREAGFRGAEQVSTATLAQRYFAGRADGLRPPNNAEEILAATAQR